MWLIVGWTKTAITLTECQKNQATGPWYMMLPPIMLKTWTLFVRGVQDNDMSIAKATRHQSLNFCSTTV